MIEIENDLYGLILAGGKSSRMGTDKGLLQYHGKPQREYLFELAQTVCERVFYSIREDQQATFNPHESITDRNEYRGPFNGMLSANTAFSNKAWLVLACDLPLIDSAAIKQLVTERNPSKVATAFATQKSGLPEPLVAIWEPQGLQQAKDYLKTTDSSCPRKFLINSDIKLVHPKNDAVLYNANSQEEFEHVKSLLDL